MRLDRFVAKKLAISERDARVAAATGGIEVNGVTTIDHLAEIDRFCRVTCGERVLQKGDSPLYIMLHKPAGILSATRDDRHPVALDLIDHPGKDGLHIAGRLDRSSTGLLLLTNDSAWSRRLMAPDSKVSKVYLVETVDPISERAVAAFAGGFYFDYEGVITRPAGLELLGSHKARVTLEEGKYHQIKRMFHRVDGNRLVSLHRESIGEFVLPPDLKAGEWRLLA